MASKLKVVTKPLQTVRQLRTDNRWTTHGKLSTTDRWYIWL